jgi:hypothetical protein
MNPDTPDQPPRWNFMEHWPQLVPPGLGIVALMGFLVAGRPPSDAYGWRMLFDIGHVPLFGVTALLMLRIVRVLRGSVSPERADFLIALLATAVLSLVAESLQLLQPGRNATVGDAAKNLVGAAGFIAVAAALRPTLWRGLGPDGPVAARLVLVAALLALGLAAMPLIEAGWNYQRRQAAFPVVADLSRGWQRPFLSLGRAEVAPVSAPAGWEDMAGSRVARVTFLDVPWPGFNVREPYPDWSEYATLRFQVWSELDAPVEIVLRVDDTHRQREHADRFNTRLIVTPGLNDFSVPLETVAEGPRERKLDLGDISQLIVLSRRPEEPFDLYFSSFWLDGP